MIMQVPKLIVTIVAVLGLLIATISCNRSDNGSADIVQGVAEKPPTSEAIRKWEKATGYMLLVANFVKTADAIKGFETLLRIDPDLVKFRSPSVLYASNYSILFKKNIDEAEYTPIRVYDFGDRVIFYTNANTDELRKALEDLPSLSENEKAIKNVGSLYVELSDELGLKKDESSFVGGGEDVTAMQAVDALSNILNWLRDKDKGEWRKGAFKKWIFKALDSKVNPNANQKMLPINIEHIKYYYDSPMMVSLGALVIDSSIKEDQFDNKLRGLGF